MPAHVAASLFMPWARLGPLCCKTEVLSPSEMRLKRSATIARSSPSYAKLSIMTLRACSLLGLLAFLSTGTLHAGLFDMLGLGKKSTNAPAAFPNLLGTALSQEQVVQGLKEALSKGVQQAVAELGHD